MSLYAVPMFRDDAPTRGEAERDAAIDEANRRCWWTDHHNLLLLAQDQNDLQLVLDMLEKPWHYTDEWIMACEHEAVEHDEPVTNVIARRLGAAKLTIEIIEVPDDEPTDEDIWRGDR